MIRNNRIIVNLQSVQYAILKYRNQYGNECDLLPKFPTNRGLQFDENAIVYESDMTMIQYARKHNLLDVWIPVLTLKLTANCTMEYTGDKALSIYKEWCARIFGKQQKRKSTK